MKVKTYNSRTIEISIYSLKQVDVKLQESYETEQDFTSDIHEIKTYPTKPKKRKRKWLKRPSLSDALLGGVISTVIAFALKYVMS